MGEIARRSRTSVTGFPSVPRESHSRLSMVRRSSPSSSRLRLTTVAARRCDKTSGTRRRRVWARHNCGAIGPFGAPDGPPQSGHRECHTPMAERSLTDTSPSNRLSSPSVTRTAEERPLMLEERSGRRGSERPGRSWVHIHRSDRQSRGHVAAEGVCPRGVPASLAACRLARLGN